MALLGGEYHTTAFVNVLEERITELAERVDALEAKLRAFDKPTAVPSEETKESEVKQTGSASSKESRSETKEQSAPEKSRRW